MKALHKALIFAAFVALIAIGINYRTKISSHYEESGAIGNVHIKLNTSSCELHLQNNGLGIITVKGITYDSTGDVKSIVDILDSPLKEGESATAKSCLCNFRIFNSYGDEIGRGNICDASAEDLIKDFQ